MSRRTPLTLAGLAAGTLALIAATAQPSAAAPLALNYLVDVSTTVKKLGLTTNFPTGTFAGTLDGGRITGDLAIPTATTRMNIGHLRLAKVKLRVIPLSQSAATFTNTGWVLHLTSTQQVQIQLVSVEALGLPINLVGSHCKTVLPVEQVLTGDVDLAGTGPGSFSDYTLAGTFTIPKFANCGLLGTEIVNATIPGAGNAVSAHFHH